MARRKALARRVKREPVDVHMDQGDEETESTDYKSNLNKRDKSESKVLLFVRLYQCYNYSISETLTISPVYYRLDF